MGFGLQVPQFQWYESLVSQIVSRAQHISHILILPRAESCFDHKETMNEVKIITLIFLMSDEMKEAV
ncbi:hypothetical protein M7I_4833 [Glarea lozoyensis 74030]|uniref:Uncharacterized protein n=1 Tax=Glarea lozoyensis (strain ATCC 74030 / MF5533) TaxID=1104152 RepID=H0EQ87_GLAL7|nr:hypothetical protein M7I_4833 [Glarea lozoyensis 74030]